jgi:hypothetical protein
MIATCLVVALSAATQGRTAEVTLGTRNAVISEPFSDAVGMAELPDGRVIVSDRIERTFTLVNFTTGERRPIGRNGTGPGEYLIPFGPIRWRGDTLLGYDPNNRRFVRITPEAAIAGTISFPDGRSNGITGWSAPRGIDPQGRIYWDTPIIDMQPVVKRSMRARLVRWSPGAASPPEVALEFADHGEFEHAHRFRPMPQSDAWVIDAQGRIGILSAAEYRLRWYRDGSVVETGPPVPFAPTRVTAAEREAFRARKALEPAGGAGLAGGPPSAARATQDPARVRAAWPDSIFPDVMPPFEVGGALVAPNGDLWVKRTGPASAATARVDILDARGALRATLRLPPRTRLFALGSRGVYLLNVDADGFQTLERYAYPDPGR